MESTKLRGSAALAAALTIATTAPALADDNKVLDRLDRLEHRIDSLESDVKERDSKIQQLDDRAAPAGHRLQAEHVPL